MRYLIFLLAFSFTFIQCKKSKIEVEEVCVRHEMLTDMQGQPIFKTLFPFKEMAYFNPKNSEEIIYRNVDGLSSVFELVKYNFVTKQKEIIYQGFFSNRPKWGRDGYILLNIQDSLGFNIYKIQDNGANLTKLTNQTNCLNPEWDIRSEHVIYQLGFTTPTKYIIMTAEGIPIDTVFSGVSSGSSWQHENLIATSTFRGLVVSNPLDEEEFLFFEQENLAQSANGAEWLDQDRVFWCHTTGIYITNIVTKDTEIIRKTCNAHCYQRPTYAADIDKIVVEKLERIKDSETSGRTLISLVMMNSDGTEEQVIEFD